MKRIIMIMLLFLVAGSLFAQDTSAAKSNTTVKRTGLICYSTISPSVPLYIVNGKIYKDSLNKIDPDEIASVQVLKDAKATAIYGSQGANGVVIITTKSKKQTLKSTNSRKDKKISAIIPLKKGSKAYVLIDGKPYTGEPDSIDTQNIQEMSVLNDKKAVAIFTNDQSYDVVIQITTMLTNDPVNPSIKL